MSILKVLAILFALLLFALSAVQIGLSAWPFVYISNHSHYRDQQTYSYTPRSSRLEYQLYFLPLNRLNRSYILQLTTGAVGVVVAILSLWFVSTQKPISVSFTGRRAPRTIPWPLAPAVLSTLFICLAIATLGVTFYDFTHHGSSAIGLMSICLAELSTASTCVSSKRHEPFTIEGWTCTSAYLNRVFSANPGTSDIRLLKKTCDITTTARYLTIPLLILPFLCMAAVFLEIRRNNMQKYAQKYWSEQPMTTTGTRQPPSISSDSPTVVNPRNSIMSPVSPMSHRTLETELRGDSHLSSEAPDKQVYEKPARQYEAGYDEMPAEKHQMYSELSATRSKDQVR